MTTRFWTAMVSLGLLCGCGDVPTAAPEAVEEHVSERTESRPHEPDGHELKAGAVDCSARTDTGYVSGSPFAISTVVVDGKPVEIDTANAYTVMQREAAADGIFLQVISGFRTQAEQQYLYGCYVNCNCNNCNLAAFPGYSNHQSGYALDLNTAAPGVYRWLERNAARFGFKRTVPSEDWHWEYFGGAPAGGVCSGAPLAPEPEPEPQGVALDFENLEDGGWYRNGIWFKVQTDAPEVHHVRYLADGYPMGVSEHRDDGFSLRYTFHSLGDREIQAEAFDAENRPIGQTTLKIRVTDGELPTESVSFATLEDGGWYRNGQWLKAEASDGVARVAYFAGKYQLGQSSDGPERFAHRVSFGTLGYRALLAVGYDAQDREVARATVLARFLPGDDPQPQVAFLTLTQGRQVPNGVLIKSMASDTVARVDYSAGGYLMGSSTDVSGHFPLDYTFSQTGQRTVKAEAFDTQGRSVAQTQVDITVSP